MLCAVDACTAVPVDLFWVSRDTPRVTVASISAVTTTTLQKEGQTVMYKAGNLNLAVDTNILTKNGKSHGKIKNEKPPLMKRESVNQLGLTVRSVVAQRFCAGRRQVPFTASVRFVRLYINFKMSYQRMDEQIVRENTEQRLTVRFGTALVPLSAV
ncbi:hypothetical protein M513_12757 [Trichuris suis]|uniref:Uncharacterized protein n=1 Tax=Trichuris suis TaxID=68888 RepID=A0A085LN40_9BILA|nr:hypothetical protein M513_12757 [Trichuris suis]